MAASPYRAAEFKPSTGLGYLGGFFAYGVGLSALYTITGFGLPCPFRVLTGWSCPFCGATRMGSALLRLDLGTAFADNGVMLIGLTILGGLGILWTVEVLGGPRIRPPRAVADRLRRVRPVGWLVVALAAAVIDTLVRNLS